MRNVAHWQRRVQGFLIQDSGNNDCDQGHAHISCSCRILITVFLLAWQQNVPQCQICRLFFGDVSFMFL